jgi:hypothetical protein
MSVFKWFAVIIPTIPTHLLTRLAQIMLSALYRTKEDETFIGDEASKIK